MFEEDKFREKIIEIKTTQLFEELLKDNPDNRRTIYLITHGANVNGIIDHYLKDKIISEVPGDYYIFKYEGSTPLHLATRRNLCKNKLLTHALLVHGADPNVLNKNNNSPLENVIKYNCTDVIKLLIRYGSKITENCLYIAVDNNRIDVVKLLKELGKLDIKDNSNSIILVLYAIDSKKYEFVREMIKLGADINTKNKNGDDALSIAIEQFDVPMVEELLNLGAKIRNYHLKISKQPIVNILLEKLYKAQ